MISKDIFVVGTYIWDLNRLQQRGLLWIEICDTSISKEFMNKGHPQLMRWNNKNIIEISASHGHQNKKINASLMWCINWNYWFRLMYNVYL